MAIVLRLGPVPLGGRRAARVAELERILGTGVELIEVFSVAQLAAAARPDVIAGRPGCTRTEPTEQGRRGRGFAPGTATALAAGTQQRCETDEHFAGYGLLTGTDVVRLADGELSSP